MPTTYRRVDSPVGPLVIVAEDDAIAELRLPGKDGSPATTDPTWRKSTGNPLLADAADQLAAYFDGGREGFDLPLAPRGTAFQRSVWDQLCAIPFGQTISYGELARRVGNPNASRAVGLANGRNPIAIVIPCHRVIGSTGKLVGFGGGLACKRTLLELESGYAVSR